jgi:hypothetical protein
MNSSKIDLVLEYFHHFTEKNLDGLSDMFASDIKLTDWNIKVHGKAQVLRENKSLFDTTKNINILVNHMAQDGDTVFSELQLVIDDTTYIKLVDIIFFDSDNKIVEIRAYKQ